ncbi:MAG: 2Fe-2S iron-sulfur cluster-binding protein [Candidatus Thiodiazotropha sp.]
MDDLLTIGAVAALVIFSVGITLLSQRRKPPVTIRESSAGEQTSPSNEPNVGAGDEAAQETTTYTINFSKSGEQHTWEPGQASLLEFAESHGIEIQSECRAGECGSCRTKLTSGEVEYRQEPSINPGRGCCLLCVSIPKSDLTLER